MEEATTFVCAQSSPLNQEPIVCADIGTAHSAAVTGEGCVPKSLRGTPPFSLFSCLWFPWAEASQRLKRHHALDVGALWSKMFGMSESNRLQRLQCILS